MLKDFNFKKAFLLALIASLLISALIGIFIFLFGDFGATESKILFTTFAVGVFSLTGLCCSALYDKKRFSTLAVFGIVSSFMALLYTVLTVWEVIDIDTLRFLYVLIILAFSSAHASILLLIEPVNKLVKSILSSTLIIIAIVAILLIPLFLELFYDPGEYYYRVLGVFSVLDVLGTIVTPILNKLYSMKS